jgi:putative membrane protein
MDVLEGFVYCIAAVCAATAWPAWASDPSRPGDANPAEPSCMATGAIINRMVLQDTTTFIQRTAEDNAAEMVAAQYAIANSRSPVVRKLARRILATGSKSNDRLLDLATRLGATMPSYPTSNQLFMLNALGTEKGAKFDSAYAVFMANEHTQDVERFVRAAGSSNIAPSVRRYAQKSLPVMQDTLQRANRLLASLAARSGEG